MNRSRLIIISGLACTGKTSFGKKIANQLSLPFINKDQFKELLFDDLGYQDREWSKKLGKSSYSLLYSTLESLLKSGISLVVESNFKPEFDRDIFLKLKQKYLFHSIEINFYCDGEILFERFKSRSESEERHPGHRDHLNYDEFENSLMGGYLEPLGISKKIIEVDTSDFKSVKITELLHKIKSEMLFDRVHHVALIVSDFEKSKDFYSNVLGFKIIEEIDRPEGDSKILYLDAGNIMLEMFSFRTTPKRLSYPEACGLRHLAFEVSDYDFVLNQLIQRNILFEKTRNDLRTGNRMTFIKDPDNLPLEIVEKGC